jgi:hypothetical protein
MLEKHKVFYLYFTAIIVNIIASYSLLLYRQPVNVDGILYLHAAELYMRHGLHAAMQIYPWPFYSLLIAKISALLHLPLLPAAYFLDVVLSSIMICFFLKIISACGGTFVHQCWGLLIILVYPFLNHERTAVLRDFGYWAFFLVSLWYFIKFLEEDKIYDGLFWQIIVLTASLFRIEGIVLLFLVPLFTVCMPGTRTLSEKSAAFLKLTVFSILLLLIALCVFPAFFHFGRVSEILNYSHFHQTTGIFAQKIVIVKEQVLGALAQDGAVWFLTGGICAVFLGAMINTAGIFAAALLLYGAYKKIIPIAPAAKKGIFIYSLSVFIILSVFLLKQLFLSERYVAPLILMLMLMLVFVVKALYDFPEARFKILIIVFLYYNAISGFGHFGVSKSYIIDAGEWSAKHIPVNAKVYINDAQIAWYAQRVNQQTPLTLDNLKTYDYFILNIKHTEKNFTQQQLINMTGRQPVKIFQNKRGDKALIFILQPFRE